MDKEWIKRAIDCLDSSLKPAPHERNEIDWKLELSPKNEKLAQHLSAFSNYSGGGFMVFGVDNKGGKVVGIPNEKANTIPDIYSNVHSNPKGWPFLLSFQLEAYL